MGLLSRLSGVIGGLFRLGSGGPQLKNNAGAIEARNAGDTDYAVFRAGTPLGAADAVPRSYADLVAHVPQLDSPQYVGMFTSHISTLRGPTLPHGGGYTVLDMNGAGYLSKIFCTLANYTGAAPSLKFQVFVDGEVTPSIDVFVEDMCCFRSGVCSSDRAGGGIGSNGLSFFFNFVAPFSSHIKVQFLDLRNDGIDRLLGGYLEYKLGTGMNWGLYGKLWSSTMDYSGIVPYATQNLLNITSATGGVFIGGYYDITGEADFHYLEGWFNAVIDGGVGATNWINGGGGAQVATGNYMFDSNEDYGEDGFYFSATGGAHNQTRNVGLTFTPAGGHVAWYKWHYENPMVFGSTFVWEFKNGFNGAFPTISNTAIKGVLWYYTGAVGSVVAPTSIKGDAGVGSVGGQGPQGIQGLPGGYTSPFSGRVITVTRNGTTSAWSVDGKTTWVAGASVALGGWYGGCWDPLHGRFIFVSNGANDPGGSHYTVDGGITWTAGGLLSASLTGWFNCTYDTAHQTVIAVAQASTSGGRYSTNGGTTWLTSASVLVSAGWFGCCYDPGHSRIIYVSGGSVDTMYTADGGVTWVAGGNASIALNALAYDPVHARVAALPASGTQSQYTTDGGVTWVNGGVVPNAQYYGLVWDPLHAKLIGIAANSSQTIYSTDGGVTWANGGTLGGGAVPIRGAIYSPYSGRVLASDTGTTNVYYTENGGLNWTTITTGITPGPILAVAYP